MVNTNGSSPLENMRGLEHYLNDIIRGPNDTADVKGKCYLLFLNVSSLKNWVKRKCACLSVKREGKNSKNKIKW